MRLFLTAVAVAVAALPGFPSAAEPRSLAVSHDDLDLAAPSGRAQLDRRVRRAVARVCAMAGTRDLRVAQASRRCAREAHARVGQAVTRLVGHGEPRLASNLPVHLPRP